MSLPELRVGDSVRVKTATEIVATLDERGTLGGLPFMPEMLRFCGRTLTVGSVAHKTCDTVWQTGGRRVENAVHLSESRCDGALHGGCQAACLIFWHASWLTKVTATSAPVERTPPPDADIVARLTRFVMAPTSTAEAPVFSCQATRLHDYSTLLRWWDIRQYARDIRSGNATVKHVLSTLLLQAVFHLRKIPIAYRFNYWLYAKLHARLRSRPAPHGAGSIAVGATTPDERLGLQVGDVVRVKSREEIFATLNAGNRNRGLSFDPEMARYCEGTYRVAGRVSRIINERTGVMMNFSNPCITLEGSVCHGEYSGRRLLCPRQITPYWREIWLARVAGQPAAPRE